LHPSDVHRHVAKEVGVQIESLHAARFPDAGFSERVLYLRVGESPVYLVSVQCAAACCLPIGWEGLIAMDGAFEMTGSMQSLPIPEAPLVKLQVFIDLGNAMFDQRPGQGPWAALPVAYPAIQSEKALERWYIEQAMTGSVAYQDFASVLRRTESYGLVRFLLEQGTHSEKLATLAQRYGVSVAFALCWRCTPWPQSASLPSVSICQVPTRPLHFSSAPCSVWGQVTVRCSSWFHSAFVERSA
jgi:hypothetical protein